MVMWPACLMPKHMERYYQSGTFLIYLHLQAFELLGWQELRQVTERSFHHAVLGSANLPTSDQHEPSILTPKLPHPKSGPIS